MTEDEAKTKVCCGPQIIATAMVVTAPKGAVGLTENAGRCIASDCMAWRWVSKGGDVVKADVKHLSKPKGEVNPPFSNTPEGYRVTSHDSWGEFTCRRDEVVGHEPGTGFCGLAGAPR